MFAGSNSELEPSSTPLMLSGISASDLTLTRDFLVMQEDHINVMNPMKLNSSLEQNVNEITETILPHDIDEETNAQMSTMKNFKKFTEQPNQILDSNKKEVQWPKDNQAIENSLCK